MIFLAHAQHMCEPGDMAKMIQVRNVPDWLHKELVRRADAEGMTLTDYIQKILEREVGRPPVEEVLAWIRTNRPIKSKKSAAQIIREVRRERDRQIERRLRG